MDVLAKLSMNCNTDTFKALVAEGVDDREALLDKALLMCCRHTRENADFAQYLIEQGADVSSVHEILGFQPIHQAAIRGNHETVGVLLRAGADLSSRNKEGNTAAALAVGSSKYACVEYLRKAGADFAVPDYRNYAPIHRAVSKLDAKLVVECLAGGANPEAVDEDGKTAAEIAAEIDDESELCRALQEGGSDRTLCLAWVLALCTDELSYSDIAQMEEVLERWKQAATGGGAGPVEEEEGDIAECGSHSPDAGAGGAEAGGGGSGQAGGEDAGPGAEPGPEEAPDGDEGD